MGHYSITLPVPDDIYDCARPDSGRDLAVH
jgi:hypothetical protein